MGRKASKKKAATGGRAEAVAWVAKHMKANPEITMSELKKLGRPEGIHVYPLLMGLARKELGWAPSEKAQAKKGVRKKRGAKKRVGRPRKAVAAPADLGDLAGAIADFSERMREIEEDRDRLRVALDQIVEIARSV